MTTDYQPFLTVTVTESGYSLPGSVFGEILRTLAMMEVGDMNATAASFECSRITIGFTPEEVADLAEYHTADIWPNVQGGTPVAQWDSGISFGCHQTLYLMPDGSFEWTEP